MHTPSTPAIGALMQAWVPVADEHGRIRLEAHWTPAAPAPAPIASAA